MEGRVTERERHTGRDTWTLRGVLRAREELRPGRDFLRPDVVGGRTASSGSIHFLALTFSCPHSSPCSTLVPFLSWVGALTKYGLRSEWFPTKVWEFRDVGTPRELGPDF